MPETNESDLKQALYEQGAAAAAPVIIHPTIGRKVWFFTAPDTPEQDATVIDVHSDRCVSLFVINRGGTTSVQRSVLLVQDGDAIPSSHHATWMPYQQGQARKHA